MLVDGFKFGRGYTYNKFINTPIAMLNLERMVRFTTEQFGMLTGIPPQFQGRSVRSQERDTIVLTRRDLSRDKFGNTINLIDQHDFTQQSMTRDELMRASIVIFLDDDGTTKILKNRYQ